jgi:hypothetical protein
MALPMPRLADRDFDQLVEEARDTLPQRAPGWTDHNVSDPGITLVELLAYLTEIGLYRLDRVSAAERRAFLRLIGYEPAPARAAQTVVVFDRAPGGGPISLPAGVQVGSADGAVVFQTAASLEIVEARLVSILTSHAGELVDRTSSLADLKTPFAPFGDRPSAGDAIYLGFDGALGAAGRLVRLYVFGDDPARDRETWTALAVEARAARHERRSACRGRAPGDIGPVGHYWEHYSARVAWEYFDASGAWRALDHAKDRTRALTLSGPVRFRLPDSLDHGPGGVPGHPGLWFIRGRLHGGEYDCAPVIRGVRANAVAARHAADVEAPESFGPSFGHAFQAYRLDRTPVVPGSSRVESTLPDASREMWTEVLDWDRSGPHDRHYFLEPETGVVTFGDGRTGRVPPDGSRFALTSRVGGGPAGNVAAGTIAVALAEGRNAAIAAWPATLARIEISQPAPALGGAAAESVDAAEGRAVRGLERDRCAVTLADYERLACVVPGAPVARAYAIPRVHPRLACLPVDGSLTVVIVPSCVAQRPSPSQALCSAVADYLDRRRSIAAEVHVVGPRYTTVTVRARLHLAVDADRRGTPAAARAALDRYFDPLRGGRDGLGWPASRNVHRSEVLALLAALPGVAHVSDLELQQNGDPAGRCGDVELCPDGLVRSGDHRIDVV